MNHTDDDVRTRRLDIEDKVEEVAAAYYALLAQQAIGVALSWTDPTHPDYYVEADLASLLYKAAHTVCRDARLQPSEAAQIQELATDQVIMHLDPTMSTVSRTDLEGMTIQAINDIILRGTLLA